MGPTAVGKSDIALILVDKFPFEIISVDSAMVYQGLNIGTAKPSKDILHSIPHRLIDIREPEAVYSVGEFCRDASFHIDKVFTQGKIPLLVGGTMMYFNALQNGISILPHANAEVRAKLEWEILTLGLPVLYQRLVKLDPSSAAKISGNDRQRIQRALEVYEMAGIPLSRLHHEVAGAKLSYEFINLIVAPPNMNYLRSKIKQRFTTMLEAGFVAEVEGLYRSGRLNVSMPSMRAIGYREIWRYLSQILSYDEMVNLIPIATAQFAKRQISWLRKKWQDAQWFNCETGIDLLVDAIYHYLDL